MATENLKVKITADASQAKAEIGKFKNTLKQTTGIAGGSNAKLSSLKQTLGSLKGVASDGVASMSGLSASMGQVAVAAGAVVLALKAMKAYISNAIQVAAAGDEIKDNAQKVHMNTTAYQEWGYVLKQNGVDIAALKTGMRKFSQEFATNRETLAKYGITANNVEDAFREAIFTIQNMATETEKIAAATELFGARAMELYPILNLTNAETQNLMMSYRLLGGTMSNELIAASDTCSDSIMAMKVAWGGLRNVLAAYVIPIVTKVVQWITLAIAYVRILLKAILGVKESFGGKGGGSKKTSLPATTGSVAKNTGGAAKNLKKAAKHAKELRRTLMGIDELSRLAEKATAAAASGGGGGGGGVGGISAGGGDIGDLGDITDLLDNDALDKLQKFAERVESIKGILHGVYEIALGLVDIVCFKYEEGIEHIKNGVTEIWKNLKELFPSLQKVEDTWKLIQSKTVELKAIVSDKFTAAWNKVKGAWDKVKSKTATTTLKLSNMFSTAWNKVKKAWGSIKSKTATIKLQFTEAIKAKWNSIAKKVNAARSKSALARTLIPSNLPLLAKGGVLTAPTTAVMGEYAGARTNPEIATPQSLMYETIQRANGDLVTAFASMTRQVISAIEQKDLDVRIGDETIARSAQRGNSAYKSRTGKALLTI